MDDGIFEGINVEEARNAGESEKQILLQAALRACILKRLDRLSACIEEHGLSPNAVFDNKKQYSLLMGAVHVGMSEGVQYLINAGADVNYQSPVNGNTPLHVAISLDGLDCTKYLVWAGADPNKPNDKGATPIDFARQLNDQAKLVLMKLPGIDVQYVGKESPQ